MLELWSWVLGISRSRLERYTISFSIAPRHETLICEIREAQPAASNSTHLKIGRRGGTCDGQVDREETLKAEGTTSTSGQSEQARRVPAPFLDSKRMHHLGTNLSDRIGALAMGQFLVSKI